MAKIYYCYTLKFPKELLEILDFDSLPGFLGSELKEVGESVIAKIYFGSDVDLPEPFANLVISESSVADDSWEDKWKDYFKPTRLSKSFWVVPPWLKGKVSVQGIPIYIYPGRTFGTGTHETTQLAVELIESVLEKGNSFFDVGSGSGILSIVAKKLGAGRVVACDVQLEAEEELRRNERLNDLSGIEFVKGSAKNVKEKFDVVVANIEKHLLEPILKDIVNRAEKFVVISGVLRSQEEEFLKNTEALDLKLLEKRLKGDWISFLFEVKDAC